MNKPGSKLVTCLWFNNEAEEAAQFYVSVFRNAQLGNITKMKNATGQKHDQDEGSVLTVSFTINGVEFIALNGRPKFQFTEAISFQVFCDTQEEIDVYWEKLSNEGIEQQCGWLKDKYGVSWQIIPTVLPKLLSDSTKAGMVTQAFLKMKKFDIETLMNI